MTRAAVGDGVVVTLTQRTEYPRSGNVTIHVTTPAPVEFALRLRIPHWSAETSVTVNGESVADVSRGEYCSVSRVWRSGDLVELALDMSLHFWAGERECDGLTSVYRGPLLLTYDRRFNEMDPDDIPALDASAMHGRMVEVDGRHRPLLLMEFPSLDGRALRLCDFGSAGEGGTPYRSWLDVRGPAPADFTRQNPLRTTRAR